MLSQNKIVRPGAIFAHGYVLSYVTVPIQNAGVQEQNILSIIILIRCNLVKLSLTSPDQLYGLLFIR